MVYKRNRRRYVRRRRNYRKPNPLKKMMGHVSTGLAYGKRLAKTVKFISGLVNSELHYYDTSGTLYPAPAAPTASILNAVPIGDDIQTRTGRSVLAKNIHIRWISKGASGFVNSMVKWVLVADRQPDASTAPSYTDLYGSNSVIGQIDKQLVGSRYVVLRQGSIILTNNSPVKNGEIFVDLTGVHCKYDGTGSTSTNLEMNGLWLLIVSDDGTYPPAFGYTSRFSFYDN